jgi:hypothetical protein
MSIVTRLGKGAPLTFAEMDGNFTTIAGLINAGFNYAVDTGSLNAIQITLATPPSLYVDGMNFSTKIANTTTSTSTLQVNALGAKNIYDEYGTLLPAGLLVAGQIYTFVYNSSLNSGSGGFNTYLTNTATQPTLATINNPGTTVGTQLTNIGSTTGATNIGYTPPGAGAVATTVAGRLNQTIVFDAGYGADPTGATDNIAAFAKAITALSNGGTIFFPAGTFLFASQLLITASNIWLVGSGEGATILTFNNATIDLISIGNGVANPVNCGISDLSVTSSVSKSAGAAVRVINATSIRLARLYLNANLYTGFDFEGGASQLFYYLENFEIHSGTIGILVGNSSLCSELRIQNGIMATMADSGIKAINASGLYISKVAASGNIGVNVIPGNGQKVAAFFGDEIISDQCTTTAWQFAPTGTGTVFASGFSNCWGCSSTGAASNGLVISAAGVKGVSFTNFKAENNKGTGIVLTGGSKICFTNCIAAANSQGVAHTYHGLYANISDFSVIGGFYGDANAGITNQQAFGIYLDTSCTQFELNGPNVRGNFSGGVSDNVTAATSKFITKVTGYNPLASTVITVGGSPFTWQNNTGDTVTLSITGNAITNATLAGLVWTVATNCAVSVPQGQSVVVTYGGAAPTMNYVGT